MQNLKCVRKIELDRLGRSNHGFNTIKIIIASLIFLTISINFSLGLSINSVEFHNPLELGSLQEIEVSANNSDEVLITIFENNILTDYSMIYSSSSKKYHYSWKPINIRTENFTITAKNENSTIKETHNFIVQDTISPIINNYNPKTNVKNNKINISVEVNENTICKYSTTSTDFNLMNPMTTINNINHKKEVSLNEGLNQFNIICEDDSGNRNSAFKLNVTLDTTPPTIISKEPTNTIKDDETIIKITTDEESTCRFDEENLDYEDMKNVFSSNSEGTIHTFELLGLIQKEYTFHIKCKDSLNNIMASSEILNFEVNLPPYASISLSPSSPLNSGTIRVTLVSSEKLTGTPSLHYNFNDDAVKRQITLTGSNTLWKGYMIIPEYNIKKVGTFYFSGVDKTGISGTEIREGKIFLVDTISPNKIASFKIEYKENIELEWFFDSDYEKFNIYKSEEKNVDYVDYYTHSRNQYYTDKNFEEGKTYYYRIAVVSEAGTIGELSEEISIIIPEKTSQQINTQGSQLNSELAKLVDSKINEVNDDLININWNINDLKNIEDVILKEYSKKIGLVESAENSKKELESTVKELEDLKKVNLTKAELERRLNLINLRISKIKNSVPTEINIIESTKFREINNLDNVERTENILLKSFILLNELDLKEFKAKNREIQNKIIIDREITILKVTTLDNTDKYYTFNSISLKSTENLKDLTTVEYIPVTFASNSKEITFFPEPEILDSGYIFQWKFENLNNNAEKKIEYFVNKKVSLNVAKEAKLSVIKTPINSIINEENKITGKTISSSDNFQISALKISSVILFIIILYYFFYIKSNKTKILKEKLVDFFNKKISNNIYLRKEKKILDKNIKHDTRQNKLKKEKYLKREKKLLEKGLLNELSQNDNEFVNFNSVDELIARGIQEVHSLNLEAAKESYEVALEALDSDFLTLEEKEILQKRLYDFYLKLDVLNSIEEGHKLIDYGASDKSDKSDNTDKIRKIIAKISNYSLLYSFGNSSNNNFNNIRFNNINDNENASSLNEENMNMNFQEYNFQEYNFQEDKFQNSYKNSENFYRIVNNANNYFNTILKKNEEF